MLPSQRDHFEIPREVCYLNAAAFSPLPRAVREAGERGASRKSRPWELTGWQNLAHDQAERARAAAAALIGAEPDDVAVISSVGYGVATAGRILPAGPGQRVIVLKDDHSSPVLEWLGRAETQGFTVETVARGEDGDWTAALLAAIERPGAAPLAVVSVSSVHWSDGGLIDLARIAPAARAQGAALVVDATHHVGVLPIDAARLDPDFLVFPTYKWVLGPYGRAFLYVAKRWQHGVPLEQTSSGRKSIDATRAPYFADATYVPDARRFDMGERDFFIGLEMASIGMEMCASWQPARIAERLGMLNARLAEGLSGEAVSLLPPDMRAPNVLSLGFPDGMPESLPQRLAEQQVHVSPRLGRLRISPHVYNDEADVDRFLEVFRALMR
ncbi:MAG: aminotransferase class V-fold PLP-dependent enzyme [Proteobacteria bacterium]|nr:aminotransferase class V-fold PLP-dependent enzyme [Pseudomonadota bacterium]